MAVALTTMMMCSAARSSTSSEQHPAGRVIVQRDDPSVKYMGLVASFGDPLEQDLTVNIMLPPNVENDPHLCEYPESLIMEIDNNNNKTIATNYSQPIALLVAIGGPCSPETKARVLLRMQTELSTPLLKVLLVYETDPKFPIGFKSLGHDNPLLAPPDEVAHIGMVKLPFWHATRLQEKMRAVQRRGNPVFWQPGSEDWSFAHSIEGGWVTENSGYRGGDDDYDDNDEEKTSSGGVYEYHGDEGLSWTRYVLFSLLMLAVCFWVGYMFHDGKLQVRRNERGRIVGLRYMP